MGYSARRKQKNCVILILPVALGPWGLLSLQQKWVPSVLPGGKGGRCVRLTTLVPSCAVVMKSGNLNFLEPSGPLQACNGIAVPFIWVIFYRECTWQSRRLITSRAMPVFSLVHLSRYVKGWPLPLHIYMFSLVCWRKEGRFMYIDTVLLLRLPYYGLTF